MTTLDGKPSRPFDPTPADYNGASVPKTLDLVLPQVANQNFSDLDQFSVAQLRQLALKEIPTELETLHAKIAGLRDLADHVLGTLVIDPRVVKTAGPTDDSAYTSDERLKMQAERKASAIAHPGVDRYLVN